MFSSDEKALGLAELRQRQQGPKHNTNARRLCCVCGMYHRPGGCVSHQHLGSSYVAVRNELTALRREMRNLRRWLARKGLKPQ